MIDFFIFILLSRERREVVCFRVFRFTFASDFLNFLLVRFHQAEIIIVKHLIQERNNEIGVGVEPLT